MSLLPFICFYGGKWRDAPNYPAPVFGRVFEPFAGGAGYSTRHHTRDIVLIEADPEIAGMWRWLIRASEADVLALPDVVPTTVRDLGLEPGPSALIGFWMNKGTSTPRQSPSRWMRDGTRADSFWGRQVRSRLAAQVGAIKHWTIIQGDFADAADDDATYFVDPPYSGPAGLCYRRRFTRFVELGAWCRERAHRGQVIACENEGATWLPFEPHRAVKANESRTGGKRSREVRWFGGVQPPQQRALEFT